MDLSTLGRLVRLLRVVALVAAALPLALTLVFAVVPPPVSALMVWRAFGGQGWDYRWVRIEQISPQLVRAVVASEDQRFCEHLGVDWTAMREVIEEARDEDGEAPARGASTLTMQTVKNLFLWPERSVVRKALEVPLAYLMDLVWSKRRIVEVYLNIAEWGEGIYGAEAAAQRLFGRSALELGRHEAALLAAALPNPLKRDAGHPKPGLARLAQRIERRMPAIDRHIGCIGIGE